MADKDISIQIKTSADTAGAKQAEAALEGLENQARQTDAALDGVSASAGSGTGGARSAAGGSRSSKGAAAAIKELAEEAPKATRAGLSFGQMAGQAGFQIQDFAVQVQGGTSKLAAFSQQAPQLLGIFGPGGAIAGALVAVGALAFKTFEATREGSEEAAAASTELVEALDKIREKMAAAAAARGGQSADAFTEALEQEADGYRRLNAEVSRNIELMQARRRAQAEIDSAQAALDLAKIDGDSSLSEEEKITARAAVQERVEQQRLQGRVAGIGERVAQAQAEAETRSGAVSSAQKAADAIRRQKEQEEARAEELRNQIAVAAEGTRQKQAQEERLAEFNRTARDPFDPDTPLIKRGGFFGVQGEIEAEISRAGVQSRTAGNAERQELASLSRPGGSIETLAKALLEAVERESKAKVAAAEAGQQRDRIIAGAQAEAEGAVNAFELQRQARGVGTSARVRMAQEQERERREAEAARGRQRQQAEAARRDGLGREGEGIADGVARGANPRQAAALEQIGNRIAADPTGGGLDQLTSAIERLLTSADAARSRELRRALERIERLEAKAKKGGDNP